MQILQLTNCSFYGNRAVENGGSIYAVGLKICIYHSTFLNNDAKLGGALYLYDTDVNISSGIYMNNIACAGGGAIYSYNSYLKLGKVDLNANKIHTYLLLMILRYIITAIRNLVEKVGPFLWKTQSKIAP